MEHNLRHRPLRKLGLNSLKRQDKKYTKANTQQKKHEKEELDETDRKITKILSQNSRTPFTKIAQKLNISTKNVTQRYKKLRRTILAISTITVSLEKLGYNAIVLLLIKVANRSKTSVTVAELLHIPNLILALEYVGGEYDLLVNIVLRDYKDLFRLEEQISTIDNIEQLDMFLDKPYPSWPLNLFATLL